MGGQQPDAFHPVDRKDDTTSNQDAKKKQELTESAPVSVMSLPMIPLAPSALVIMLLSGLVFWQRKRQFDRKGYHKKRESDLQD